MPGPPKKPTALKVLEGNPGRRRLPEEPKFRDGQVLCPPYLSKDAKLEWKRLAPELLALGLLKPADQSNFARYCEAHSRWKQATEFIRDNGLFCNVRNKAGEITSSFALPHVKIAEQAAKEARMYGAEFGLTPASRAKLGTLPAPRKRGAVNAVPPAGGLAEFMRG